MKQYHDLLIDILENGDNTDDRTGVGTKSVFGRQLRFNLKEGFPAITTKKLAWKAVVGELLWFLEGSSDERRLAEITHGTRDGTTTIWTPNSMASYWKDKASYEGDLGRVYGVQWRSWRTYKHSISYNWGEERDVHLVKQSTPVDQIQNLINGLKNDPHSRRHIISAWNVGELDQMALPPCHVMSQFHVNTKRELSCHMYQRSSDCFLGAPFNIASYALLTHMIAQVCNMNVNELIISIGDAHIYNYHIVRVMEQLERQEFPLPTLWLNKDITSIDKFTMADIGLVDYQSHGPLKAPMAV